MAEFTFFGGKGGVGKTTVSSAYGVQCADADLDTLLVSTDPAHSTSDVFDQQFDDTPSEVDGYDHLWAMEIDPEEAVEEHLMDIRRQMADQVSQVVVNEIDAQIEMAHNTPGAYEAALFDRVIEVMETEAGEYDRVVFDTSPTGGTLRLLSLPEFLGGWVDRLIEKREKSLDLYEKAALGPNEPTKSLDDDPIIARLRERKERFEFAGETLREDATFYLVLNPDELSISETRRAIEQLGEYDLSVAGVVANKITPAPDDGENGRGATYLRGVCERERERINTVEEEFPVPIVARIESRTTEVKGDVLQDVADALEIDVTRDAPAAH